MIQNVNGNSKASAQLARANRNIKNCEAHSLITYTCVILKEVNFTFYKKIKKFSVALFTSHNVHPVVHGDYSDRRE